MIMICIYSKSDQGIPFDVLDKDYIHFRDKYHGEYIICSIDNFFIDDEWRRIPLKFGEIISQRDSTVWIHPETRSDATKILNSMHNNWVSALLSYDGDTDE